MLLYLLRHGNAGAYSMPDSARDLTPVGEREVSSMIQSILADGYPINAVVSSTYKRAKQTAGIVSSLAAINTPSAEFEEFTPDTPTRTAMQQLEIVMVDGLVVATHQPLVGHLIGLLVHGDTSHAYPLTTGSCACLEVDFVAPACADLKWIREP